jgi:ATP-dependent Lon protease
VKRNGLAEEEVALAPDALATVIADYTREAGVRQLER